MTVVSTTPGRVRIEVASPVSSDTWSFTNVYAGVIGLGERIENVVGLALNGEPISTRRLAAGEFRTNQGVSRISYEVRLAEPSRTADKSHISWLTSNEGLLMMADLLPIAAKAVSINVKAPQGWSVASVAQKENGSFVSIESSQLVFLLGKNIRSKEVQKESSKWLLSFTDGWRIPEKEVKQAVSQIVKEYTKLTGFRIQKDSALHLLGDPGRSAEQWSAETRGATVVLLMGQRGEQRELVARLKVILAHELFHLWVPNALSLSGDYDWFFEGFTLYQALRTTQKLGLVDFAEYLRTISRVYDSYLVVPDRDSLSLLDLSARRWTSSHSLLYHRGMLVAFLYDLQLRLLSDGKQSVADVYRELFTDAHGKRSADANDVIINILERPDGMGRFPAKYIEAGEPIDLEKLLLPYGIEVTRENFKTQLNVSRNLNDEQRRLLKSIGYKK